MEKVIKQYYPDSDTGLNVTKKVMETLFRDHQFDAKRTILGTSVCSDEIVRTSTNIRDYINVKNPFSLGGLGGFPFAGITGFGAFAGHIPDRGYAIIQYGPHIGISKTGAVGSVKRIGQSLESACCGALKACVNNIVAKQTQERDSDLDYQQWKLEEQLQENSAEIAAHPEPLVAATDAMYKRIDNRIKKLLEESSASFANCTVVLVGGVIINTDFELNDWFDLRELSVTTF